MRCNKKVFSLSLSSLSASVCANVCVCVCVCVCSGGNNGTLASPSNSLLFNSLSLTFFFEKSNDATRRIIFFSI